MTNRQILGLVLLVFVTATPSHAGAFTTHNTTITVVNVDGPGEGFNDPTPVTPVAGNPGATLGDQRWNSVNAAVGFWEIILGSDVEIVFEVGWSDLFCVEFGAILGGASSTDIARDFPTAPMAGTFYPIALANSIQGSDLSPSFGDINAEFNAAIDAGDPMCNLGIGWWYGIGSPPPGSEIPLDVVVFHELAHGLGFSSEARLDNGAWLNGFPAIYDVFLEDHSTGKLWPNMNNAERLASAVDTGDLHWVGPMVNAGQNILSAGIANGHIRMYAPAMIAFGSSVSHWDEVITPDELMEPLREPNPITSISERAFEEEGWVVFVHRDGFESNDFSGWSSTQGSAGVVP